MGWYAVCNRELLLLFRKMGKLGYAFSALLSPLIYLFAFGLGLGGRVQIDGGYLPFLVGGIVSITVMLNAFQQTALSVSVGRLYFRTFQTLLLSTVSSAQIMLGLIMAGVIRSLLAGTIVLLLAWLFFGAELSPAFAFAAMLLGAFCFAALGVVIGLFVRNPDDVSFIMNFLITPMIFFGGAFFPVQNLPWALAILARIFPIGLVNTVMRAGTWSPEVGQAMLCLLLLSALLLAGGGWLIHRYDE